MPTRADVVEARILDAARRGAKLDAGGAAGDEVAVVDGDVGDVVRVEQRRGGERERAAVERDAFKPAVAAACSARSMKAPPAKTSRLSPGTPIRCARSGSTTLETAVAARRQEERLAVAAA